MHCQRKEDVKRMSETLYGVDQFYTGDFAPILIGVYNRMGFLVLFTNTRMSAEDILMIYRQKDVV